MRKMHFEILIKAKPEEVWNAIVDDKKYRNGQVPSRKVPTSKAVGTKAIKYSF
jgi:hypothetical protein